MTIQLLYHDPNSPGGISPFDAAIRSIALDGNLRLACPYISLDYLNEVINDTSWRLLTDIKELLRSTKGITQRERMVEFLNDHRSRVRHYSRLHAKVVIGLRRVMFGSGNFTNSGIWNRVEVSAIIDDALQVQELTDWFDACWKSPQARDVPPKDVMAEYIKSLPEEPAPVEEDVPELFPPLLTNQAPIAWGEDSHETASQIPAHMQEEALAQSPTETLDDVSFPYVQSSPAVDVSATKRRSSKKDLVRRYLVPLIRTARKARLEDIPFLQALADRTITNSKRDFGPNTGEGHDPNERKIREVVSLARRVSEISLPTLRELASEVQWKENLWNKTEYPEDYDDEIRKELGVR